MHLPLIRKVFENKEIQLVPIMVGELNNQNLEEYGKIFQRYLQDPRNLFIISSDFCHWGNNFDYKPYDRNKGEIFEYIEDLDRTGMGLIERHDLSGFLNYLERTENTICGRNPISIAISTILHSNLPLRTSFIRYAQSNPVRRQSEFSVSYATSVSVLE